VLPHVAASRRDAVSLAEPPVYDWRRPAIVTLITALAASLLLLLARGVFDFGPADRGSVIAMAQRDLDQGRLGEAFASMETYLSGGRDVSEDQRAKATAILESSGYELARGGLAKGDFGRVSDIEHRVSRHSGGSSRLLNLRIQAERGETAEQSLSRRRSLVQDYGYEADGKRQIKDFSIPEITPTQRRIEAELLAGIESFPDSLDLRLNYGQSLLDQNEFQRAEAVFAEAIRRAPHSVLAQTGLGLALFQQNRPDTIQRALEHFRKAVDLSPDDARVNLNLAVCLTRLGRETQARPYFKKANSFNPEPTATSEPGRR
jgi:tetratricopeptide (TPR) repeat protein